ncbi:MAG: tetratricopeptide repeat protein [Bacteroidota bacterium]
MKRMMVISVLLLLSFFVHGQKERKYIREGNKAFEKEHFQNAEVAYSKALKEPTLQHDASFNIGDALYKQEKYPEALEQFSSLEDIAKTPEQKASIYHNMGNSLLKQKKYKESIEAYKQALRAVPTDLDTKYNLTYAQKMLKDEQDKNQQNKQNKNKDQDKQKDQKDQKDQNNQDNQQNKQNQQDQQNKQDKKEDSQQQQQQQQQQQLSKEDAERLLKAIANDEKKIQEKVKEKQAKAKHKKTTKEW